MQPFVLDEPVNGTFWPELQSNESITDYDSGYYKVYIEEHENCMTGYRCCYSYYDAKEDRVCTLSSISLPRLRKKVLLAELPWFVTDINKAIDTLSMNLLDMHYRNTVLAERLYNDKFSGVRYVRKRHRKDRNECFWEYRRYDPNTQTSSIVFGANKLINLKEKVKNHGFKWEVIHPETYNAIINRESL